MARNLAQRLGGTPSACWLFCSPEAGLAELLKGVREAAGTDTIIGCTTDGEVCEAGFCTKSAVLGGILTDRIEFSVVAVEGIGRDPEGAGRDLAQKLPQGTKYLQLFSDGLTGNGNAMLRGVASHLGNSVPVGGGTAGDAGRFHRTWQFIGDRLLTDAAVAIGFSGDFRLGTGVESGWMPIGLPKRVTRASGNILYELNGERALRVYERFLGKHASRLPGVGVEYPLLIVGNYAGFSDESVRLLRATMAVDRKNGSIRFAGDIPEGAMVCLTCGDRASVLRAVSSAARHALEDFKTDAGDGSEALSPGIVFSYSCMARKIVLGRNTKEELSLIRQAVGTQVPVIGFYSYGEYCRTRRGGPSLLHNETATISVLGI